MQRGERIRLRLCFGLFAGLAVVLFLRLAWLQVLQVGKGRASVARQRDRFETLPEARESRIARAT